jgi:hypothetical protein
MEAFDQLRRQAKDLRDKMIAEAREQYEGSLRRIAELERDLSGEVKHTLKSVAASIEAAMPRDKPFNTADLKASLEAINPRRVWGYRVINHRVGYLVARGTLRRLRQSNGKSRAVYVRAGVRVDLKPLELVPLVDHIEAALRELGPMELTPLAVAILERGYKSKSSVSVFRNTICRLLRAYRERFAKTGDKWRLEA